MPANNALLNKGIRTSIPSVLAFVTLQSAVTGLPTWGSGQPGQVGNQAALTVEPVLGSRLVNLMGCQSRRHPSHPWADGTS
jgi:hypothetical protein